jgi:arylsulfatase A-like enzyme
MTKSSAFSRRDILKLLACAPAALAAHSFLPSSILSDAPDAPNVIIFVLDAWSANHLSIFGYPRQTMPNMERFATKAHVFHNHYSAGTFTVPGTASLLSGMHPWTHRALHLGSGGVLPRERTHQLFNVLKNSHSTFGYSQNPFADMLLYQFEKDLDVHLSNGEFSLERHQLYDLPVIQHDAAIAFSAFDNSIFKKNRGLDGSFFFEPIYRLAVLYEQNSLQRKYKRQYPYGLPTSNESFTLEKTIDGSIAALQNLQEPALAYFHLLPPHAPYRPTKQYSNMFEDGLTYTNKPIHPLSQTRKSTADENEERLKYDQFLASWDAELERLLNFLETKGLLDRSIVLFTSDHGELFERGEIGHNTLLLSDPVVHVPLFVSLPGQQVQRDIHTLTSSVDIMPTLLHLLGQKAPAWNEAKLLPELGGSQDANRSIFAFDAKMQSAFAPWTRFSMSITRQGYKLIYYQYPNYTSYEYYCLIEDPDELVDLYPKSPHLALQMRDELREKLDSTDRSQ